MAYIIYSLDTEKFRQLVEQPTADQLNILADILHSKSARGASEKWTGSLPEIISHRLALPDWYGDLTDQDKSIWEWTVFSACMGHEQIDLGFEVNSDGVSSDLIEKPVKHLKKSRASVALAAFGSRPYRFFGPLFEAADDDDFQATLVRFKSYLEILTTNPMEFGDQLTAVENDPVLAQGQKKVLLSLWKEVIGEDDDLDYDDDEPWRAMHSMHPTEEVRQMLSELSSVEKPLRERPNLWEEYEEELKPALESIIATNRMLFVQTDT